MRSTALLLVLAILAAPPLDADPVHAGDFRVTYYWLALEDARFAGLARDQELHARDGRTLARVSTAFRRELDREGSGRLADGRVLNVDLRVAGVWRYREVLPADGEAWGLSANGSRLRPFFSLATDPRRIATGACVFVPAFAEVALPDGSLHGGRFAADDVGSAITGSRIDVFIGEVRHLARFEAVVPSNATTAVFLDPAPESAGVP